MGTRPVFLLCAVSCACLCLSACTPAPRQTVPVTAPTIVAETKATQWDMVIFGDSDMWSFFDYYAKYLEQDLGVSITIHDEIRMAMPSTSWLSTLRDNRSLRAQLAKAEIVIFNVPLVFPMMGGACFDYTVKLEQGCFGESPETYAKNTRQIIQHVKSLVGKKGAMLRLQNGYVPVDWWQSNEYLKERADACLACFAHYWQAQAQVAAEEGIPVIDMFAAFHGANRDQNPAETGLIDADGIHLNEAGAKYQAGLYRQLGYAWWRP